MDCLTFPLLCDGLVSHSHYSVMDLSHILTTPWWNCLTFPLSWWWICLMHPLPGWSEASYLHTCWLDNDPSSHTCQLLNGLAPTLHSRQVNSWSLTLLHVGQGPSTVGQDTANGRQGSYKPTNLQQDMRSLKYKNASRCMQNSHKPTMVAQNTQSQDNQPR